METRKKRSNQWNPENAIVREIIKEYESGMSARKMGFKYGVADVTITSLLKRHNIFVRNRSNAKRTNQIREDVFDTITEESAYWIGFILADGNIHQAKKRSKQLTIGLAERDWEHLEKFKKFIGSNKSLYYNNKAVFLSIYSNRIADKLAEYGIVPRKSKIAKVPEILKNNRHFWRGMVDGDGWISQRQDGSIATGICGTHDIVYNFKKFVYLSLEHVFNVKIRCKTQYFCEISYAGSYVSDILKILYLNSNVFLTRKKLLANGV